MYYNGAWGTVCDDFWDDNDAEVVCRQLGFPADIVKSYIEAYFGGGSGAIFLDDVKCSGYEEYLSQCPHAGWGIENCIHDEDAGVSCGELCIQVYHIKVTSISEDQLTGNKI